MNTVTYSIPKINCGHCVHTIQTELQDLTGVISVKADVNTKQVVIVYEAPTTEEQIKRLLQEINYPVEN
jgi:copper chaperone